MRNPFKPPAQANDAYAHSRTEREYAAVNEPEMLAGTNRYAVPNQTGNYPVSGFGWAPLLESGTTRTPDSERLQITPVHEYRNKKDQPPSAYWDAIDADKESRSNVEYQDADGWQETKTGFGFPNPKDGANRFARNPREIPSDEPRQTQALAPRSYVFMRPFMTGQAKMGSRHLNGIHFSMADHRRTYPILGMHAPKRPGYGTRNTYRLDPPPWDTSLTDAPPVNQSLPEMATLPTINVAYSSRSWRL